MQEALDFEGIEEDDDDPGEKLWALVLHADIFLEAIAGGLGSSELLCCMAPGPEHDEVDRAAALERSAPLALPAREAAPGRAADFEAALRGVLDPEVGRDTFKK